jgi:hypothetical protein
MEKGFLCDGNRDDDVTVPEHSSHSPSCRNPIGIGKSTTHDAHDSDDDELQRYSKGVGHSLLNERPCDGPRAMGAQERQSAMPV